MNCALCDLRRLLRNSHIIPEFLYETLYDTKHRFHQLSVCPEEKNHFLQKGLRQRLLCDECEQHLGVFDRYASQVLNGGVGIGYHQEGNKLSLSNLNYGLLKLFQLSILWRAGISSLKMFAQVSLGSHEERIKQMIKNRDPGPSAEYGCLMVALLNDNRPMQGLIVEPTWAKLAGHRAYRFVFGGMAWVYIVSHHLPPEFVSNNFVQLDGTAVVILEEFQNLTFLMKTFAQLNKRGKL